MTSAKMVMTLQLHRQQFHQKSAQQQRRRAGTGCLTCEYVVKRNEMMFTLWVRGRSPLFKGFKRAKPPYSVAVVFNLGSQNKILFFEIFDDFFEIFDDELWPIFTL